MKKFELTKIFLVHRLQILLRILWFFPFAEIVSGLVVIQHYSRDYMSPEK